MVDLQIRNSVSLIALAASYQSSVDLLNAVDKLQGLCVVLFRNARHKLAVSFFKVLSSKAKVV